MASETASAVPRLLYEDGFEGWDISMATVWTDYVILVVGLLCAGLVYKGYKDTWQSLEAVSASFVLFSLCEGICYGFGGVSHHMLASYFQDGAVMSKSWGEGSWEWMITWVLAMVFGPLATAFGFGMALSYAEVGVGCIRFTKVLGCLVTAWEVAMCIVSIDKSGTIALFWSLFSAAVSLGVIFRNGAQVGGIWLVAAGWLSRIAAYLLVLTVPPACKGGETVAIETDSGTLYRNVPGECMYSRDFNHNAIFHVLIALSLVFIFIGVDTKLSKEREAAYMSMMRNSYEKTGSARCCGV